MFGKTRDFAAVGTILEGLPIPVEVTTIVKLTSEGFHIQALIGRNKDDWKNFELSLDKVQSVQMYDERQIKQIVEQSAPGMVVGAATFGLLGAMVGGRTKTKEKTVIRNILVIEYQSDEKKQIILDVTNNIKDCTRMVNHFRELKPVQNQTIQL